MSIAINDFSNISQINKALNGVDDKTRISLGDSPLIGGKTVKVGVTDRGRAVRTELLESLKKTFRCGAGGVIPKKVLDAMKAGEAFSGFSVGKGGVIKVTNHPLTARRLRAIVSAVEEALKYGDVSKDLKSRDSESVDTNKVLKDVDLEFWDEKDSQAVVNGVRNYDTAVKAGKVDSATQSLFNGLSKRQQALIKGLMQNAFSGPNYAAKMANYYVNTVGAEKIEQYVVESNTLPDAVRIRKIQGVPIGKPKGVKNAYGR